MDRRSTRITRFGKEKKTIFDVHRKVSYGSIPPLLAYFNKKKFILKGQLPLSPSIETLEKWRYNFFVTASLITKIKVNQPISILKKISRWVNVATLTDCIY